MKKGKKLLLWGIGLSLGFSVFFWMLNSIEDVKADTKVQEKTEDEVIEEMNNGAEVAISQTKEMWQNAIAISNKQQQLSSHNDPQLQKWIIRTVMEKKVVGKDVYPSEAERIAKERLEYENAWLEIAVKNYNIVYTDEEVDTWIANGPDKNPVPAMYEQAKALNLTLEELNHEYDRDFYVKWVVWEKLHPILAEKYDVDLNAEYSPSEPAPNTILVNHYDQEIKEYLSKE